MTPSPYDSPIRRHSILLSKSPKLLNISLFGDSLLLFIANVADYWIG